MSSLEVDELVRAVSAQDTSALTKVPGVGKKTAERLLVELKDRFKAWEVVPSMFALVPNQPDMPAGQVASAESDAVSALSLWAISRRRQARRCRPSKTRT